MHHFKSIQIFSNGVVNFPYKTFKTLKVYTVLEKDHKNFYLNLKNINLKSSGGTFYSNFKNKYFH